VIIGTGRPEGFSDESQAKASKKADAHNKPEFPGTFQHWLVLKTKDGYSNHGFGYGRGGLHWQQLAQPNGPKIPCLYVCERGRSDLCRKSRQP